MPEHHRPARNPPKWPKQSMLLGPTDVKRMVKTINMMQTHTSWHLRMGPILFKPDQLMMMQPIMTPKMPQRQVEAPALTLVVLQSAENMLPAIADTMQMMMHLMVPKLYSNLDSSMMVLVKLPKKCIKLTCKTAAVINLHTQPRRTSGGQLAPIFMRHSTLICSNSPSLCKPSTASAINTAKQTTNIKVVKEKHLKTGQHISSNMSKQFSSLGFFTLRRPDRNSTLCFYTYLKCSIVSPYELPSPPRYPPLFYDGLCLRFAQLLLLLNPWIFIGWVGFEYCLEYYFKCIQGCQKQVFTILPHPNTQPPHIHAVSYAIHPHSGVPQGKQQNRQPAWQ